MAARNRSLTSLSPCWVDTGDVRVLLQEVYADFGSASLREYRKARCDTVNVAFVQPVLTDAQDGEDLRSDIRVDDWQDAWRATCSVPSSAEIEPASLLTCHVVLSEQDAAVLIAYYQDTQTVLEGTHDGGACVSLRYATHQAEQRDACASPPPPPEHVPLVVHRCSEALHSTGLGRRSAV